MDGGSVNCLIMFTTKKTTLFKVPAKSTGTKQKNTDTGSDSAFVNAGMKSTAITSSGNGALKYSTTGNPFVDQFGKVGSYKPTVNKKEKTFRSFQEIEKDCEILWAKNPLNTVRFILYLRMITRIVTLFSGISTKVSQKGAEMRYEGQMRMIWLAQKAPDTFWKNIGLFVSVGSWRDVFQLLSLDIQYNGWDKRTLNWAKFGNLILTGLENTNTRDLIKKWLPQIKAKSDCKTVEAQADNIIAKWICSLLYGAKESSYSYKQYRLLKSSGTAHQWQKLISQKQFDRIDFATIHGLALSKMVRSKFLTNQGLKDKYEAWITKPETSAVKFTGFVHELFAKLPSSLSQVSVAVRETINKQFATLVNKAKDNTERKTNLIVVRDTSGSMGSTATGTNMSCYDIGKALALYFSEFLTGKFASAWIEFNSDAQMHQWRGNTPMEKWYNDNSSFVGSTNFQSVINLFVRLKNQGIAESEFPTGILAISDSEFNPASLGKTNVETALNTLRKAGFSEDYVSNFTIVLWNLQSSYYGNGTGEKFETYGGVPNVYYFSGYSTATVAFLTENIKNAEELFEAAMSQEILQMVEL